MRIAIKPFLLGCALGVLASTTVSAQSSGPAIGGPMVVIVKVAKPWYAPDFLVVRKMRAALPQYQRIPGLTYKIFSLARPGGEFGGIYLWQDRASAEAWFNPAWFRRVKTERGVDADVRMFDAPMMFDNRPAAGVASAEHAVVAVVTVPTPDGMTREGMQRGFEAEMRIERGAPGLLRRYAIIASDNRFGGVYLWRDEASAKRWFDAAWQRKMREIHGVAPRIEWFDAPILMPSELPANREAEHAMAGEAMR